MTGDEEEETVEINIEEIMKEIRKEAEALRYEEPVSFEDVEVLTVTRDDSAAFNLKKTEETLNRLNALWEIPYGHEITGNPLKKLTARAARKVNKPTGLPMTQDITRFNAESVECFNELFQFVQESLKKEEEQNRRIFELESEIRALRKSTEKKA